MAPEYDDRHTITIDRNFAKRCTIRKRMADRVYTVGKHTTCDSGKKKELVREGIRKVALRCIHVQRWDSGGV